MADPFLFQDSIIDQPYSAPNRRPLWKKMPTFIGAHLATYPPMEAGLWKGFDLDYTYLKYQADQF